MEAVLITKDGEYSLRKAIGKRLKKCREKACDKAIKVYLDEEGGRDLKFHDRRKIIIKIMAKYRRSAISNLLGIGQSSLSRYESGEITIDIYVLAQLSIAYEIDFAELFPEKFNELVREDLNI